MMTRPDIACAVRAVARFREKPRPAYKKEVLKVIRISAAHEGVGDHALWAGL